jgi:hypothetical protein
MTVLDSWLLLICCVVVLGGLGLLFFNVLGSVIEEIRWRRAVDAAELSEWFDTPSAEITAQTANKAAKTGKWAAIKKVIYGWS